VPNLGVQCGMPDLDQSCYSYLEARGCRPNVLSIVGCMRGLDGAAAHP
jgi:hypothetical protein